MNKYIEILTAIDVAHMTGNNVLEIPNSFLDAELEKALNIGTGSSLGNRKGKLAQFEVRVYPDVRSSFDQVRSNNV